MFTASVSAKLHRMDYICWILDGNKLQNKQNTKLRLASDSDIFINSSDIQFTFTFIVRLCVIENGFSDITSATHK